MARKTITVDDDGDAPLTIEGVVEDVSAIADDNAELESNIVAEMGASENNVTFKVSVYRIPDTGKEYPYLFSIPGESIAGIRERLMRDYGDGYYAIHVYKITSPGGAKLHRKFRCKIELPRTAPAPQQDHGGSALVAMVAQQGKAIEALLTQIATLRAPAPVAPPAMDFAGIASVISAVQGMIPKPAPAPNPLELMGTVVDLVKGLSDEGREKTMFDMVGEVLKSPIMETIVKGTQQQATQPQITQQPRVTHQRPPQAPGTNATPPAASAPAPTHAAQPEQSASEQAFYSLLSMLVGAARKNAPHDLYADLVADMIDPGQLEQLLGMPDPVGLLAQYSTEVETHRAWFAAVISELTNPGDGVESEGTPTPVGNAANATGRAPAPVAADGNPERD